MKTRSWTLTDLKNRLDDLMGGHAAAPSLASLKQWSRSGVIAREGSLEQAAESLREKVSSGQIRLRGPRSCPASARREPEGGSWSPERLGDDKPPIQGLREPAALQGPQIEPMLKRMDEAISGLKREVQQMRIEMVAALAGIPNQAAHSPLIAPELKAAIAQIDDVRRFMMAQQAHVASKTPASPRDASGAATQDTDLYLTLQRIAARLSRMEEAISRLSPSQ